MNKQEQKETVKNVIITALFFLIAVGGGTVISVTFPKVNAKTVTDGITADSVLKTPEHIKENPFKNFIIDADVKIGIKDNFNIYSATAYDYDFDKWTEVFLKDKKIVESTVDTPDQGTGRDNTADDGSMVRTSRGRVAGGGFSTKEMGNKQLAYYVTDSGEVHPLRDSLFPKRELDFMSSDEAVSIVKKAAEDLKLPIKAYNVYSIDYDYINKIDERDLKLYGEDQLFIEHTKDDEFYLIVMEAGLPNNGTIAEIYYDTSANTYMSVYGGKLHACVGKNGLLNFSVNGLFNVTGEEKNEKIISFEKALNIIKDRYSGVKMTNEFRLFKIELSYLPIIEDDDLMNPVYKLTPAWIFRMYEDMGGEFGFRYFNNIIDATTGKEVNIL